MTTAHRPARTSAAGRTASVQPPDVGLLLRTRVEHRHRGAPAGDRLALHLVPPADGTRTGLCGARVALRPPSTMEPERLCAECLALRDEAARPPASRHRS